MNLSLLFWLAAFLVLPCRVQAQTLSPAWEARIKKLPRKVRPVVRKAVFCNSLGGNELTAADQKLWNTTQCEGFEDEIAQLRIQYVSHAKVLATLDCVEENINAKPDCPQ